MGDASGSLVKYHEYLDVPTSDGQTLSLEIEPPLVLDRIMIRTIGSPSWVAWREVRVFGVPAPQPLADGTPGDAGDGSGRLFVVEQKGRIRVISNGNLLPTPFLDISEHVICCHEQGLFSVAFPPNYGERK